MNGQMDEWMNQWRHVQMDRGMDEEMERWSVRMMDRYREKPIHS